MDSLSVPIYVEISLLLILVILPDAETDDADADGIFRMYKPNFNGRRAQETSRKIEEKFLTSQ